MRYDGLLLDHDGVIVTPGDASALTEATERALRDAGADPPDEAHVEALRLWADIEDVERVSDDLGITSADLWRYRDDRVAEALRAETTAGRKVPYDDVSALDGLSGPLGIVSNNQTRVVEFVLDHYGLADRFETVRARAPRPDSLRRKKPAPTYLEEAMGDLGLENPLYVGDSETDVVAGHRLGLDVAFLRRAHNAVRDIGVEPRYEVDGLDAVVSLVDGG
jgi:HAD superfamily hydrolase (TIGR01549 family)